MMTTPQDGPIDTHRPAAETAVPVRQMAPPGYYAVPEEFGRLTDALDRLLRRNIVRTFADARPVNERRYPTLLATEALRRSGYLVNFPSLVSVTAHLADPGMADPQADAVTDDAAGGLGPYVVSDAVLPPTMCLHIYEEFRLTRANPLEHPVVTARGPAFRREVNSADPLKRLSEFTIRECVFFGDRETVWRRRELAQDMALKIADEIGLPCRMAVASDAFFANPAGSRNQRIQQMMKAKYEMLCPAGDDEVAVASFNFSGRKFVDSYNLNAEPGVVSGCLGFGLERLAMVLVRRHGSVAAAREAVTQACGGE